MKKVKVISIVVLISFASIFSAFKLTSTSTQNKILAFAGFDSCHVNTGCYSNMNSVDNIYILGKLQQIKNSLNNGAPITGTVTATGIDLADLKDSLHKQMKFLSYTGNVSEGISYAQAIGNNNTNSIGVSTSVLASNFGGYGNSFIGKYGVTNLTNSVFWTNGLNSVFQDTINYISVGNYAKYQKDFNDTLLTVFLDISGKGVFTSNGSNAKSYFKNTGLSDTLIASTASMASLVTAVNLFYTQHPNRQIKDVQYANAVVAATLTYWAIVRYED